MPVSFRAASDTQLSGAFIVDPPGATAHADRVLVIAEWTSLTRLQLRDWRARTIRAPRFGRSIRASPF